MHDEHESVYDTRVEIGTGSITGMQKQVGEDLAKFQESENRSQKYCGCSQSRKSFAKNRVDPITCDKNENNNWKNNL